MKKCLFLTNYPAPYRVEFFNQLGSAGIELTVVFTCSTEDSIIRDARWFRSDFPGFTAVFCKTRKKTPAGYYCPEVLEWCKKDFDKIIFGGYSEPSFMAAMSYLKKKKIPFSLEIDGGLIKNDNILLRGLKKHFISMASEWICSGRIPEKYLLHYGAGKEILRYRFSSMTENELREAKSTLSRKAEYKKKLGMSEAPLVLFAGRFCEEKGVNEVLEVAKRMPSLSFLLVGGEPTPEMVRFCGENGLKNVTFHGFRVKEALSEYYAAADVFLFPTYYDVWGLVVPEAMAYGVPSVTTDCCVSGMELIRDGVNGYVTPAKAPEEMADRIGKVLENLEDMRLASVEAVKDYSIEGMVKMHLSIM